MGEMIGSFKFRLVTRQHCCVLRGQTFEDAVMVATVRH